MVTRALQTGREPDQVPARARWVSAWRQAWASISPLRLVTARSDIWKDDFRLSLAAACIAALASIVFVTYERSGHGGGTTRPLWADQLAVQSETPHALPASRSPESGLAASTAGSAAQGGQRLASAASRDGQPHATAAPVFGVEPPASATPRRTGVARPDRAGRVEPQADRRAAAPPSLSAQDAPPATGPSSNNAPTTKTSGNGTDAVAPTQAEIAGLRQLQASASAGGGRPRASPPQPGAQTVETTQPGGSGVSAASPPAQPAPQAASPALPPPASPAPAAPASAVASAGSAAPPAALSDLSSPVSVRTLPVPPSASDPRTRQAAAGRLNSTAAAAVLLLYPDRDAEALRRLRPLAIRLQEEGITNIRARPTRALPARRAISYFYTDDEPLAHVIAQTLSQADWPRLDGNSLQPSLVLLPPGLHPRRPGTVEIQLP